MFHIAIQIRDLISSNVSNMVDCATDPAKMLKQLRREIEESIIALRGDEGQARRRAAHLGSVSPIGAQSTRITVVGRLAGTWSESLLRISNRLPRAPQAFTTWERISRPWRIAEPKVTATGALPFPKNRRRSLMSSPRAPSSW